MPENPPTHLPFLVLDVGGFIDQLAVRNPYGWCCGKISVAGESAASGSRRHWNPSTHSKVRKTADRIDSRKFYPDDVRVQVR
jgi:hypothetical protein